MAHRDRVLGQFLEHQCAEGLALAEASDLVELVPLGPAPVQKYFARFHCTGLVRRGHDVSEHDAFLIAICFPDDYLRQFDTARVLTWCDPFEVWHPNIRPPYICVGQMLPGTTLPDLLYQLYEIINYQNVEMRENNALNHDACVWARQNVHLFPVDRRPLKRRTPSLDAGHVERNPDACPQEG